MRVDYSRIAGYYDSIRGTANIDFWSAKICEFLSLKKGERVVDIGCGTGRHALSLANRPGLDVVGLDRSKEMLREAVLKDRRGKVAWMLGDARQLPFKDMEFDGVYVVMVIQHMKNKRKCYSEMHRVLRTGGRCVIVTSSHERFKRHLLNDFPKVTSIDKKRFPPIPKVMREMKEVGFSNLRHSLIRGQKTRIAVNEYLKKVRGKFVSTFNLMSEKEFSEGYRVFEKRLRKKYGNAIGHRTEFNFVVGTKACGRCACDSGQSSLRKITV